MRPYLFVSFFVFLVHSCSKGQEKVFPEKMPLTESVYASVTIQPDSLYQVYSAVGGILEQNMVEEGDLVKQHTALLQINNSTTKLNTENAKLAMQLAHKNYSGSATMLKVLGDEIKSATLTFKNDSINYFRQKRLWAQRIGSKEQFDNRTLAYELSRNKLNSLGSRYKQTKNELETQLRQTRNNYVSSRINTNDFTVTSRINGKVYALFKEPGEIVSTMEPLALVGSESLFVIEMLVDEVDIVRLVLGQKTLITLDAYPLELFEARVSKIYPRKDERSQTFTVEAIFKVQPRTLYPGLSGEGNVVISEKEETLTIPRAYLLEGNQVMTSDG